MQLGCSGENKWSKVGEDFYSTNSVGELSHASQNSVLGLMRPRGYSCPEELGI